MRMLTFHEFLATAKLWRDEDKAIVGFFIRLGHLLVGRVEVASKESGGVALHMTTVMNQTWPSEEAPIVVVSEGDLMSCWHLSTFEQPQGASLVADHFDEQLLLNLRSGTVTLYRASAFKATSQKASTR